jgi:hypothetical protein
MLHLQPVTLRNANRFITQHHRHHKPPQGAKFAIGVNNGEHLVGVIVVGRPVARILDDNQTAEVTRCCTDGTRNACSLLYGAAWRAARAMGYHRLITYTLETEPGTSLRAAGWELIGPAGGGGWNRPGRPRKDDHPTEPKLLWAQSAE